MAGPGAGRLPRGGVGYCDRLSDLEQLISVFRTYWAVVEPKTPVTMADLRDADRLVQRFARALGQRQCGVAPDAASADLRQRAFTKLVDVYGRVRRAVAFVRYDEGDADVLAPSLWAGRGGRGRARPATDDDGATARVGGLPGLPADAGATT